MKSLRRKNAEKLCVLLIVCTLISCIVCITAYRFWGESGLITLILPVEMIMAILQYIQNSETLIFSLPNEIAKKLKNYEQKYGRLMEINVVYDNVSYTGCCEYDIEAHYHKKKELVFESGKVISFEEDDFEVTKIIGEEKAGLV